MACRDGITQFLIGIALSGRRTTGFSSPSKRAIRALRKWKRASCLSKPAGSTSRSSTKTDMLRGFFLIFFLTGIAMVAFLGFRGQHSTRSPIELFPDMVLQPKVRAQAPLGFFADNRGARVPIGGTVPIGYEFPKPQMIATPASTVPAGEVEHAIGFSEGTDYF